MEQKPIRAFVPPTRPKPKPQEGEFSEPIWKWLKILAWLVGIILGINALLWVLSRGF